MTKNGERNEWMEFKRVFPFLAPVTSVDGVALLTALTRRQVSAATPIITPGGIADTLYFIYSGKVRVVAETTSVVLKLGEFGAGQWIGELGLVEPAPATVSAIAAEDSEIFGLTHQAFSQLRRDRPTLSSVLLQTLSRQLSSRLRHTIEHLDAVNGALELAPDAQQHWLADALRRVLGITARSAT